MNAVEGLGVFVATTISLRLLSTCTDLAQLVSLSRDVIFFVILVAVAFLVTRVGLL